MADAKAYDLYPTVIIVDKTNLCEKCNLFFKIPSDLNLHISLKHELKTHIVVHTGEKNKFEGKTNFNCKQCDFYFSEAFELKEHVYTKNHFIRHMQIHSKERGFHCDYMHTKLHHTNRSIFHPYHMKLPDDKERDPVLGE